MRRWSIPPAHADALNEVRPSTMRNGLWAFLNELQFEGFVPIGGIIPWAKSLTGVPDLGPGWVECDGSTLDDPGSPLDGQTIPDLNGDTALLRGADTSGSAGEVASGTGVNTYDVVFIMRTR